MKRFEIYMPEAIEEDFEKLLSLHGISNYSRLNPTMGRGEKTPNLNNDVWPGRNTTYIIYSDRYDVLKLIVEELRNLFPKEGIAAFVSEAAAL